MKKLRVLHINDAAGQAWELSREQRKLGLKADLLLFNETPFDYGYDFNLNYDESFLGKLKLNLHFPTWFKRELMDYDIFHFYSKYRRFFSSKLAFFDFDIKLLKAFNKKFVFHFLGSDVRQLDISRRYKFHYADDLGFDPRIEQRKREMLAWYRSFADLMIVGDYELEEYVPGGVVLPIAYDVETIGSLPTKFSEDGVVRIVHSPTQRIIKGTETILSTVEKLKKELKNLKIELELVENVPHREALKIYSEADICIDQLRLGSYGTFSVESMALGKPVVCYIRDDLTKKYKNLPIVNANPETLYESLKQLVLEGKLRAKLGEMGKAYVASRHKPEKVAKESLNLYESLNKK